MSTRFEARIVKLAQTIARGAHAGQFRRDGTTPYITHIEQVVERVAQRLLTEQGSFVASSSAGSRTQAAAWLHDVIEDSDYTANDLRDIGIPFDVVQAVQLLTKREDQPYDAYIAAIKSNTIARRVKIADMLSNLADGPTNKQIVKYSKALLILL